jgi:hypothetical protein
METELINKKKKKKKDTFILQDVYTNGSEEILDSKQQIKIKLTRILRNHIGIENSINPFDLFYYVYNIQPQDLNIYKRNYWWDVIKFVLREMRRDNELFTIIKGSKIFVLSNKEELKYYIKVSDNHIKSIENLKKNAKKWVEQKKYLNLR